MTSDEYSAHFPGNGPVETAVLTDLAELPPKMRKGGIAAVALYAARALDEGGMAPRDAAAFAQRVQVALVQLRDMAPGDVKGDVTDEVRERREKRLAGGK